eukprot:m.197110 g.197110  ORF g.197110 m.197110 type:complete len:248 (-) comp17659_c0_seq4:1345-2088(-)
MRTLSLLFVVLAVACIAMAAPAPKRNDNDDRRGGNGGNNNNSANRTTTTTSPRTTSTHVPRTENATRLGEVVNCSLSVVANLTNSTDADAFRTCLANVTTGRGLRSCVRAFRNTTDGNDTAIVDGLRSCAGLPPACNSSVNATAAIEACVGALNSTADDVIAFKACIAAAQNQTTTGHSHDDQRQRCLALLSSTNAQSFLACAGPVVRCSRDGDDSSDSDSDSEDDGPRGGPRGPGGRHRRSIAVAL